MRKIIVPVDFSDTSADALRYGCYLADVTGYNLEVIHVHDGYDGEDGFIVMKGAPRIRTRVLRRLEAFTGMHADRMTFTATRNANGDLPLITCRELIGQAASRLLEASRQNDAALMVMGGVGSGLFTRVTPLFGSVARRVATKAGCPVLLIPQNSGVPKITNAAIAFDDAVTLVGLNKKSDFLRRALSVNLRFTHVLFQDARLEEAMEMDLLHEILHKDFPDHTVDFDMLPAGDVTNRLIDYSLERDIDLLILGRHDRGFLMNLLVRSEIPDIVGASGIPLLIVPLEHSAPQP